MPERVPAEQHVREFARSCVRSGLLGEQHPAGLRRYVAEQRDDLARALRARAAA